MRRQVFPRLSAVLVRVQEWGFKKHQPVRECLGSREVLTRTSKHRYKAKGLGNLHTPGRHHKGKRSRYPDLLDFKVKHKISSITIFAEKKKKLNCREKENSPLAKLITTSIFRSLAVDKVLCVIWSLY